jgi:branched-chain amino acid transport system permease protein
VKHVHPLLILAVVLGLFPLIVPYTALATQVLIFGLFALGYNLLLGYTGLLSFGHALYFGLGSYTTALTLMYVKLGLWGGLACGMLAGTLAALLFGWFCLWRRGLYFAMLTLAFAQMVYFIFFQLSWLTGGDDGLRGVPMPALTIPGVLSLDISSTTHPFRFYYFTLAVLLSAVLILWRLVHSPFGKVLEAIRESEERAKACGYNTTMVKHLSFLISGMCAGLAGGLNALLLGFVPLEALFWTTSGTVVIMTLLGGVGTFLGPLAGAGVVLFLEDYMSRVTDSWPLIVGAIFVLCVLFFRRGIWGTLAPLVQTAKYRR